MDLDDLVNKNPELFTRDHIENLNYLVIVGAEEEAINIAESLIEENGGCGLCGEVPMTTNCNNARCQDWS